MRLKWFEIEVNYETVSVRVGKVKVVHGCMGKKEKTSGQKTFIPQQKWCYLGRHLRIETETPNGADPYSYEVSLVFLF